MRAAGAAILGAAIVGAGVLLASNSQAASPESEVDFDVDAEVALAMNYYANAITDPIAWSAGQLVSLEGLLVELGFEKEATNIADMRIGLYGSEQPTPEPLPDIQYIPLTEIDAIADALEGQTEP